MFEFLQQAYQRLLDHTSLDFKRYLFESFKPMRLTGLVGPRGVGKTTLMLQYIKTHFSDPHQAFYFSADSVYFQQSQLLTFIDQLYQLHGIKFFFIDEIHKYDNWTQELKNIYDAFPDVQVVYSGSSMLEIVKGSHDLSRRASIYQLAGMSFREYLNFTTVSNHDAIDLKQLLEKPSAFNQLSRIEMLAGHFKKYLAQGYYPFVFEESHHYYQRIIRIIDKIIFEDIPNYYDLKTHNLHLFKKILGFVASIPPGEINTNNLAKNMNVAHQTITHYLSILDSVGLIRLVYPREGGNQYLRKPQKIFLHNTVLLHALGQFTEQGVDVGNMRELYFTQALADAKQPVFYSKQGDFLIKDGIFEIGGKNKTMSQIKQAEQPAFLVKDDTLVAHGHSIPLLYFGFLY